MTGESVSNRVELGIYNGHRYSVITELVNNLTTSFSLEDQETLAGSYNESTVLKPHLVGGLTVIDSVSSGTGRRKDCDFVSLVIVPLFERLDMDYQLVKTTSKDSIKEYAATQKLDRDRTVLFFSGDTSVSEYINSLPHNFDCKLELLLFPMGTGNAYASSLRLKDPATILSQFLNNELRSSPFPLYRATFGNDHSVIFFIILSLGFHANLLHLCEQEEYQKMGIERFRLASQEILKNYDLDCRLSIPNVLNDSSFSYFALINTTHLEPAYLPSPLSDPLDSTLYLLAYDSTVNREELRNKIMKGYTNSIGTDISEQGTVYRPLPSTFKVNVNKSTENRSSFEVCCDGQLLNLLDFEESTSDDNMRTIEIEACTRNSFRVLHPTAKISHHQ